MELPQSEADRYFSVRSGCGKERQWAILSGNDYFRDYNLREDNGS